MRAQRKENIKSDLMFTNPRGTLPNSLQRPGREEVWGKYSILIITTVFSRVKLPVQGPHYFHRHEMVFPSRTPPLPTTLASSSLSNLCILRKYMMEFILAGLMAFINLGNSEMFDWNMAFLLSKRYSPPLCYASHFKKTH